MKDGVGELVLEVGQHNGGMAAQWWCRVWGTCCVPNLVDTGGGAYGYGWLNLPSTSTLRKKSSTVAPTPTVASSFSSDGLRGKDIVHFLLLVVLLRAFTNLIAKDWPKSFTLLPYCAPLN